MSPTNEAGVAMLAAPAPRHQARAESGPCAPAALALAGDYLAAIAERHGFGAEYRLRLRQAEEMLRATQGKPGARSLAARAYSALAEKTRSRATGEAPGDPLDKTSLGRHARSEEHAMPHHAAAGEKPAALRSLLTYKAAADLLGVCPATVYNLVRRGDLRAIKLGRQANSPVRIDPADLAAYLERSKAPAAARERGR